MSVKKLCLICLISPDDKPDEHLFVVKMNDDDTVSQLKKLIKDDYPHRLRNVDAPDLVLWKCSIPDDNDLQKTLETIRFDVPDARLCHLRPSSKISEYFATTLLGKTIHILVEVPALDSPKQMHRTYSPVAIDDSSIAQRESTVKALYDRLDRYKFVLVRGTPASGKSTLAKLLYKHILNKGVTPILISRWRNRGETSEWYDFLWDAKDPQVILDEAQLTYWDTTFWNNFLKMIKPKSIHRVILFASYGSPSGRVSVEGTTMIIPGHQHVALRPIDHGDGIASSGLFLTEEEFADMVQKGSPGRFASNFLAFVLSVTTGHPGAVEDLLQIVLAHDSYRHLNEAEYSLEIFRTQLPINVFWSGLDNGSIFRRGFPFFEDLQRPEIARVFRLVLSNNSIASNSLEKKDDKALMECFRGGWLHAIQSPLSGLPIQYVFTTPLHRLFVEYHLGIRTVDSTPIAEQTLFAFAVKVIRGFSFLRLSSKRMVGASDTQRLPEAQFQDEFYRCCAQSSNGSLITFPEFGNATGRIDFYIPCRMWGVEVLRNGEGLANHSSHFLGSATYAQMSFDDYIMLDFRETKPRVKHPEMKRLYHIVFSNDFKNAEIFNSLLKKLDGFALLD